MQNLFRTLLAMATLLTAGCRTEIGGIASINEAADAANDPSVTFFPIDESLMTHHRESGSNARSQITGVVTSVPNDSDASPDSSTIQITDANNGRKYKLLLNNNSFAHDLAVHFDGRPAKIVLDVKLNPQTTKIPDENIVQYGPPD